jgi:hypothetical protein
MKRSLFTDQQVAFILRQTAKLNGVEPMAWLTDVLERSVSGRTKATELDQLLPWNWKLNSRDQILPAGDFPSACRAPRWHYVRGMAASAQPSAAAKRSARPKWHSLLGAFMRPRDSSAVSRP